MVWYCTREDVREALDSKESAYNNKAVDRVIETASRTVEQWLNRIFYPTIATKYFDFPSHKYSRSYRLWFDEPAELISATSVVSGGIIIDPSAYYTEPVNVGPPYNRIEINLASTSAFNATSTYQRQTVIQGLWGYREDLQVVTTLAEDLDTTETGIDINNSGLIGVGDTIKVGSEYMVVTDKSMLDTAQNTSALALSKSAVSITGLTPGALNVGEIILIDSERMLIVDAAGSTVTVERAVDGSVLAAHALNADIYALRTLTVSRGSLGTTAASHLTAASVSVLVIPSPVRELTLAEAVNNLLQSRSGYARVVGSGDNQRESYGKGLSDLRQRVENTYGRKTRKLAV